MIPHSQPWITSAEHAAVAAVLDSAMLARGEKTKEFELNLSEYLGKKYALFTGNGTQAQMLILKALGVGEGDEVIMPTYVCDKVYKGIKAVGATPVLCDVGEQWVMTTDTIKAKITSKTKAIVLVHIFGINAWEDGMSTLGIPVIEDICQSLGHVSREKRTGTKTPYAFSSFHGTKCLGLGEGGMLFADDESAFQKVLDLKNDSGFYTVGTDILAAIGLSQWQRYSDALHSRNRIAQKYDKELPAELNVVYTNIDNDSMHYRYVLRSEKNWKQIQKAYLEKGIHVRKGVDSLIHRWLGLDDAEFPNAVKLFESTVSIPILPQLTGEETDQIVSATKELHEKGIL